MLKNIDIQLLEASPFSERTFGSAPGTMVEACCVVFGTHVEVFVSRVVVARI